MMDFMKGKISAEGKRKYLIIAAVTFCVYFAMRYLSPIASPFILAFLIAGALNPLIQKIHKKMKIKQSVTAGLVLILICIGAALLLWFLCAILFSKGGEIAGQASFYEEEFCRLLGACCDHMEERFGIDGMAVETFILEQVNILAENIEINVLPAVMNKSMDYVKGAAGFFGFLAVMMIAVLLLVKDYEAIVGKIKENEDLQGVWEVTGKVIRYIKTFLKAQLIILSIISTVCALTLGIMGMKGGILYGIITGFMDMLPFIGTGIMLLPLALLRLIEGSWGKALVCLLLYAVCAFLREFLEPKLIGNKVGIWPVGILFAVFAGLKLFGLWGIIKGPISLVIICETCKYLFGGKN